MTETTESTPSHPVAKRARPIGPEIVCAQIKTGNIMSLARWAASINGNVSVVPGSTPEGDHLRVPKEASTDGKDFMLRMGEWLVDDGGTFSGMSLDEFDAQFEVIS